jgi:glycerol-3-phosphate O-acyltransferase
MNDPAAIGGIMLRLGAGAPVTSTIALPLWLVVIVGVLSVMAALDHLLLPSARWVMRRRLNRAIDELNTRLKLRIQPFKLAKRQSLIDQLLFDPEVLREICCGRQ